MMHFARPPDAQDGLVSWYSGHSKDADGQLITAVYLADIVIQWPGCVVGRPTEERHAAIVLMLNVMFTHRHSSIVRGVLSVRHTQGAGRDHFH